MFHALRPALVTRRLWDEWLRLRTGATPHFVVEARSGARRFELSLRSRSSCGEGSFRDELGRGSLVGAHYDQGDHVVELQGRGRSEDEQLRWSAPARNQPLHPALGEHLRVLFGGPRRGERLDRVSGLLEQATFRLIRIELR